MGWKRKLGIGIGVIILVIIVLGISFSHLIPYSFDRSTYNNGYELQEAFPNLEFENLVHLTHDGVNQDRLYAVQQKGQIVYFPLDSQVEETTLLLDLSDTVACCGEAGLLGLTFDPDFANNGYFYLDYNVNDPLRTIISRFTMSNGTVDLDSELVIFSVNQPYSNHNAGTITFGPDGMLYITLGDGGSANDPHDNGQSLNTYLGSILRINVTGATGETSYTIPEDNPFVGQENVKEEIWAYGLRNPWKISFDSVTGTLWAGDVGQNRYEEVNIIVKGGNYGWNTMEASHCFEPEEGCSTDGLILPVAEYGRDEGESISGGYVYRGSLAPDLVGKYIYADYLSSRFWYLGSEDPQLGDDVDFMKYNKLISGFGQDYYNELYVLEYSFDLGGKIYHIVPE